MPSPTYRYQLYRCPEWFEQKLREVGGTNRYGGNNFLVRWAQGGQDECYYRAGGIWSGEGQIPYTGYRNLLLGGGTPSWMLLQWHPSEHYGTPEMWYMQNYDEASGLQTLGEYPYRGKYELLYNLRWSEKRGNTLYFEAMPLNSFLLRTVVPIIIAAKGISYEKTKAALLDQRAREDAIDVNNIEDVMRTSALPFKGAPVSYTKQGCRTSLVDKKIEQMTRNWNQIQRTAKSLGKGLSQRQA